MKKNKSDNQSEITVRRPDYGLNGDFERHWFAGNPVLTHMMNAMHAVFPVGERQFIKSVKVFDAAISKDKELEGQVKAFIGQEMQHAKQHDIFLMTLDRMGLDASGYARWFAETAFMNDNKISSEEFWLPILKPFFSAGAADRAMLSFTAALEHLTASLAETLLKDESILAGMPENMRNLFLWHAVEEIEHKAVAFDVFQQAAKGTYAERITGFVFGMFYLNYFITRGFIHFMAHDNKVNMASLPGAAANAAPVLLKLLGGVAVRLVPYLKPDFHPNETDNRYLAAAMTEGLILAERKVA